MPRAATVSSPAVPSISRRSPPVRGGVPAGGGVAASSMGGSVVTGADEQGGARHGAPVLRGAVPWRRGEGGGRVS
ncbi:hypothetical protein GCM10010447_26550 [Streptomyces fulvorobeus]